MPTARLIAYLAAWVVAAVMMAVVAAILIVEVARLVGVAEPDTTSYRVVLNVSFLLVLGILVAVPFVFRKRFNRYEAPPPDA